MGGDFLRKLIHHCDSHNEKRQSLRMLLVPASSCNFIVPVFNSFHLLPAGQKTEDQE